MCFVYDGYCAVYEESVVTARKPHVCRSCRKQIEPGQQYLRVFSVYEGDACTSKICNLCTQDAVAIHRHELREGCDGSESWCAWDDVYHTMRRGGEEMAETILGTPEEFEFGHVLTWPYGVPPAAQPIDLRTLAELQANNG